MLRRTRLHRSRPLRSTRQSVVPQQIESLESRLLMSAVSLLPRVNFLKNPSRSRGVVEVAAPIIRDLVQSRIQPAKTIERTTTTSVPEVKTQPAPVLEAVTEAVPTTILKSVASVVDALPATTDVLQAAVEESSPAIALALSPALPTAPSVVGRYTFYSGTTRFGDAYASDKGALLPGQTATFNHITSYAGGINEIVIDVANGGTYTASDFTFRLGNSGDPSTWTAAPAPYSVTTTFGAGVSGSARVIIKWADGSIVNQWLQINFTALADTFYFGNLVGSTGTFNVSATDEAAVRANPTTLLSPAAISNTFDFNRDAKVDALDQILARTAKGASLTALTAPTIQTQTAAYDWHTQTINGILNIWAPNPYDFGNTWTVTDPNGLFGADGIPQMTSIRQGPTADCYFLSAEGALAYSNPSRIQSIVSNDSTGGYAVKFQYWDSLTGNYKTIIIHTSREISSSLQYPDGEVWSAVIEKAYAAFRTWNGVTSTNTMASLGWGYAGTALLALNNSYTTSPYIGMPADWVYSNLQTALAAHRPVLFHTSTTAPTLVASHVYVITAVSTDANGVKWITSYNPWGFFDTRTMAEFLSNGSGSFVFGTA